MDIVLWGVLPYLVIVTLVGGTVWRYRYDKFGWTTRSSQLYESRLLRIGSPLFHFGILLVLVGHIGGLVIPESWTEAVGVSEGSTTSTPCSSAGSPGSARWLASSSSSTGVARLAGVHGDHPQRQAHVHPARRCDRPASGRRWSASEPAPRRTTTETVSPWFRSVFLLRPDVEAMAEAPIQFHIHALVGMALFALWPFSRLVHAFTAPLHYLFRPYIVYRSRTWPTRVRAPPAAAGVRSGPATATVADPPSQERSMTHPGAGAAPAVDLRGQTKNLVVATAVLSPLPSGPGT